MSIKPSLDDSGDVIPHDHSELSNDGTAIRRVNELQVSNMADGSRKLSSVVFKSTNDNPDEGMSIDLLQLMEEAGIDPVSHVTTPRWIGSIAIPIGTIRENGLQVGYDPLPENLYHGEVWGKITRGKRKALCRSASWFVEIEGVDIC